jgi:MFS transporter, AAHS family, 3-hydroxyphenylpropionic acid transporter
MQERVALAAVPNVAVTVALCFLVAVVEGFDIQALGVVAPRLTQEFLLSPGQLSLIFAASNVGLVFGASGGGWLADRVGRKPVFMGAVLTFGLFTLLTTMASGYPSLFVLRFCAGLGFGAALPNLMAVAAEVSAPEKRASTAAVMFCGMPVGGGLSALLTQVLPPDYDWRVLFVIGGVFPLILAPAIHFLMPETLPKRVEAAPRKNIPLALFGEGRAPATLLLWLTFLPTLLILYLILNWLPSLVVANGLDRAVAPQASLAFNWASVAGALVFGKLVDRMGARGPLTFAYVGLIGALLALSNSHGIASTVALSGAAGFFLLGANYALYGVAAMYYPQDIRGTGSGASVAVGRIGSIIGPLLAGVLLGGGMSASGVVQYMVPVAAIAGTAVFVLSFCRRPAQ